MGSLGWCIYQLTTENCKETASVDKKVENVEKLLYKFLLCEIEFLLRHHINCNIHHDVCEYMQHRIIYGQRRMYVHVY